MWTKLIGVRQPRKTGTVCPTWKEYICPFKTKIHFNKADDLLMYPQKDRLINIVVVPGVGIVPDRYGWQQAKIRAYRYFNMRP
jgi:hypothetical protein